MNFFKKEDKQFQVVFELLPEHFFLPEIFTNENMIHIGMAETEAKQKYTNDQWHLPKWALNHHDMIKVMRETLESKYVQENLGSWVDLQFGCDQFRRDKFNEFYPWTYPEWWDKSTDFYKTWEKKKVELELTQYENEYFDLDDYKMMNEMQYLLVIPNGF